MLDIKMSAANRFLLEQIAYDSRRMDNPEYSLDRVNYNTWY